MDPQPVVLVALLVGTAVVGLVWRRRQGRVRVGAGRNPTTTPDAWDAPLASLGVAPGTRATFLQFSAAVCAPCRATARTLAELAAAHPDVAHVEVDVEDHLDLVLRARVLRTPTVLVLDPAGSEVARASGAMTPAQARAALDAVVPTDLASGRSA
jgi:thiol-disulfide isomerase/thioredoxin